MKIGKKTLSAAFVAVACIGTIGVSASSASAKADFSCVQSKVTSTEAFTDGSTAAITFNPKC